MLLFDNEKVQRTKFKSNTRSTILIFPSIFIELNISN